LEHIPAADHPIELIAGALPLDFTNTLGGTHRAPSHEHLQSYADLVEFARSAGALSAIEARRLHAEAERRPSAATDVLHRARSLREAIWRIFDALARGGQAKPADLMLLNREGAVAAPHEVILADGGSFRRGWSEEVSLDRPLWPIARGAMDLLTDDAARARLRECASETCEWLFIDRTKNHSRRWCDMKDCGNRAKVRRFRQRQRAPTTKVSR
jgi:predicted RNA-binding Zn ribbon-like protein